MTPQSNKRVFNEHQKQQARVNASFSKMTMGSAHCMERTQVRTNTAVAPATHILRHMLGSTAVLSVACILILVTSGMKCVFFCILTAESSVALGAPKIEQARAQTEQPLTPTPQLRPTRTEKRPEPPKQAPRLFI